MELYPFPPDQVQLHNTALALSLSNKQDSISDLIITRGCHKCCKHSFNA